MSLTQFLTDPDLVLLNKLLPSDEFAIGEFPELTHAVNIQVNVFRCGGIALGICNTHRLHDGTSEGVFLKEWAAIAQGSGGGNSVTKRFTFTGPAIEALRARGKGPSAKNPTRVEAVTGLLWKLYDIDFGWGRPVWVSNIGLCKPMFLNLIFLVDTRSGDGIEAWVPTDEQEMALLQENPELHAFATVNPSPLTISSKLCGSRDNAFAIR
ncbi:hypothetical protein CRG98_047690 [Punica granatum]|uniref:Uncharacterized protein n=1 Tax=Punica granatum TaxID=22663 RepID=A0A2I0HJN1_PUNGR|nr:hypothetical protein CRG98_047690 [Punica granatum]